MATPVGIMGFFDINDDMEMQLFRHIVRLSRGFFAASFVVTLARYLPDGRHVYLHRKRVVWVPTDLGWESMYSAEMQQIINLHGYGWGSVD